MKLPDRPTLMLDAARCRRNIARMAEKARAAGARFRPHFKTHQSRAVGAFFREEGVTAITVSSVAMAEYFAADGWRDITIAFPFNPREAPRLAGLPADLALQLLVEDADVVRALDRAVQRAADVFVKIDTGAGRTGLAWDDTVAVDSVLHALDGCRRLSFAGFLTHAGDCYGAADAQGVLIRHERANERLRTLRRRYARGSLSVGDTPGCSLSTAYEGIDELRPGNFVFYDVMQLGLGSCREEDIAVALCCPVVAAHPSRNELVLYGGAVHLSRDSATLADGRSCYGLVAEIRGDGWGPAEEGCFMRALSQEHGIVRASDEFIRRHPPGSVLAVLPVHSCMTAQAMGWYADLDGNSLDHLSGRWL